MYKYADFENQLQKILQFNQDLEISDSMIVQGCYNNIVPNFYQVIEYYEEIGVIKNVRKINVKVWKKVADKEFKLTTTKTIFDFCNKNQKSIVIDKENNEYEIDENGRFVCVGRFELQRYVNQ